MRARVGRQELDVAGHEGKTALVTGGTAGIGLEIARGLAGRRCRVILVGRDPARGERAVAELRRVASHGPVEFLSADLSLVSEIDRLADELYRRKHGLDCLVHSAGIMRGRSTVTSEGIEANFATNYLARFALNRRLLPLLVAAGDDAAGAARIVMISGAARGGRISFDDVNLTGRFTMLRAVLQFCQANDVHTVDLARRLAAMRLARQVTVTCLKVGVVKTGIRREFPYWMKLLVPLLFDPLLGQTAAEVAEAALELALSPRFEGASGALFMKIRGFRPVAATASARDEEQGSRLWALSAALCAAAEANAGTGEVEWHRLHA
jgi:NAD(P)-dependent dehydrogenase (short-subunit alcohol dehydrogenase family)